MRIEPSRAERKVKSDERNAGEYISFVVGLAEIEPTIIH